MKNNRHSIREFETLFNNHKINLLDLYFANDVSITRGDGETHVGAPLILDFLQELVNSYPNARVSVNRMQTLERNAVIAEWYFSGSQSESGRVVNAAFAALLTFDDKGIVARVEVRGDTASLYADAPVAEVAKLNPDKIKQMTENYKVAWCTRDPNQVASFYAKTGFIIINGGTPWAGRPGLAAMSGGFYDAYPDAMLATDNLHIEGDRAVWSWTFTGTNTGPGGNGKKAQFSGYEVWRIDENYQIAESYGYYDSSV